MIKPETIKPVIIEIAALSSAQACLAEFAALVVIGIPVAVICGGCQAGYVVMLPSIVMGIEDPGKMLVIWILPGSSIEFMSFGVKVGVAKRDSVPIEPSTSFEKHISDTALLLSFLVSLYPW